jgi:hypothetical protein
MKNISSAIIAAIILVFIAGSAYSQTRNGTNLGSVEWSMGFNTGRASDYISEPSFSGASLTFKRFVKDNLAVGIAFNWNVFSKEEPDGYTVFANGAVSGAQARYLNYVPILATLGYYFNEGHRNKFIPYVQANVGASYVGQRLQLGVNKIDNDNWHFMIGPEAGFMYVLGSDVMMTVNGKYNYALSSGETLAGESGNDYSYFNANIGIGYYLR